VSFTVKVTTPLALEAPEAAEMVELPVPWPRVTVLPDTGLLLASLSVTVMVEVVTPSAVTDVGLADTVECEADTAPAVNVTLAVWVITRFESVVSVAV
jgi:hypothetical protein